MIRILKGLMCGALIFTVMACGKRQSGSVRADLIITDARIYTADASRRMVEAMAIRDGRIIYAGDADDALALAGPGTRIEKMGGKLVLPGLIDANMHPLEIAAEGACGLKNEAKSLAGLSAFVKDCIARAKLSRGQWVFVDGWNALEDNAPDPKHPTLRAALDAASKKHPIRLTDSDGQRSAFNSAGLALAQDADGKTAGLSARTLKDRFSAYRPFIGIDSQGEPDGILSGPAVSLINGADRLARGFARLMKTPRRAPERLNAAGITAIQDAAATQRDMQLFDTLADTGKLTLHVRLAQAFDFTAYRTGDGETDFGRMVQDARAVRMKYLNHPFIQADAVTLYLDGPLEGNPNASPPGLPAAAMLKPYLQPLFGRDAAGMLTVKGYADPDRPPCRKVRPGEIAAAEREIFRKQYGFYPAQCALSDGALRHSGAEIAEFARRFHLEDFTLQLHAHGDRAVRLALDAIEAARGADGVAVQPDAITGLRLVAPEDMKRFGKNRLFVIFSFGLVNARKERDMVTIPFIDRISGNADAALYAPANAFVRQAYPARSVLEADGLLAAGSGGLIQSRDPNPFSGMQRAITRQNPGFLPLNPAEALDIGDAVDAYTIGGARAMRMDQRIGSLETGKDADFIVVDRNIFDMAKDAAQRHKIKDARVLGTWLAGRPVYTAPAPAPASRARQ